MQNTKTGNLISRNEFQITIGKVAARVADLYDRYRDEKGYEKFSDYEPAIKAKIDKIDGVKFVKLDRPFSFVIDLNGSHIRVAGRGRATWTADLLETGVPLNLLG